jgi:ABC-type branched-subunit amino acid transport system ATPase component
MADPEVLGRVGFVAQDTPLYPDFTPEDLIRLGRTLNARFDERLAFERLRQLEIPTDRTVQRLSGGQRAQVALAIVLAKRPSLLLLDSRSRAWTRSHGASSSRSWRAAWPRRASRSCCRPTCSPISSACATT